MRHQMEAERGKEALRSALISPSEEPCYIPGERVAGNMYTHTHTHACTKVYMHTDTISVMTLATDFYSHKLAEQIHKDYKKHTRTQRSCWTNATCSTS